MTSLAEVYEGHMGEVQNLRRLYLGTGLFAIGTLLIIVGIVVATATSVTEWLALKDWEAWKYGGLCAGLGLPAVFVGVFTVLPASRRERAAAAIGSGVAILGVMLFWHAFPYRWYGLENDLTMYVVIVYFFGAVTTFWCLFTAIANFKTRNNPGGSLTFQVSGDNEETRTVEVSADNIEEAQDALGGVGVLGDIVDQTETAGPTPSASQPTGAFTDAEVVTDDAEVVGGASDSDSSSGEDSSSTPDVYCGNCSHFSYVRTARGIQPYCGLHEHEMDDMDACDQWQANRET